MTGSLLSATHEGRIALGVLAGSIVLGLLAVSHSVLLLAVFGIGACLAVALRFPIPATAAYFVFILFQDLLVNLFSFQPNVSATLKMADEGILVGLLIATVGGIALRRQKPIWHPSFAWLAVALALGVPPTIYFGTPLNLAALDLFLMIKGFLVFFVVLHLPLVEAQAERIVKFLLALGIIALFFAALDLIFGESFRAAVGNVGPVGVRHGVTGVVSLFAHEGVAGWFFAYVAAVSLAVYTARRSNLLLVLLVLFSAGAVLSLRRKALLGLAIVFVLAVLLQTGRQSFRRTAIVTLLIVVIAVLSVGNVVVAIFEDMLDLYVLNPNKREVARNAMYVGSTKIAVDHFPFGAGFGVFGGWVSVLHYSPLYYEYGLSRIFGLSERDSSFQQDAFWPHILGELGFFGCAFFVCAILACLRSSLRAAKNSSEYIRVLGLIGVFVIVESFVESVGWVVFENTMAGSFLFGIVAVAILFDRQSRLSEKQNGTTAELDASAGLAVERPA